MRARGQWLGNLCVKIEREQPTSQRAGTTRELGIVVLMRERCKKRGLVRLERGLETDALATLGLGAVRQERRGNIGQVGDGGCRHDGALGA